MNGIGMKVLAKINVRARAARARGHEAADKHDWELSRAFGELGRAYEWCCTVIEDILEEIKDEEGK